MPIITLTLVTEDALTLRFANCSRIFLRVGYRCCVSVSYMSLFKIILILTIFCHSSFNIRPW